MKPYNVAYRAASAPQMVQVQANSEEEAASRVRADIESVGQEVLEISAEEAPIDPNDDTVYVPPTEEVED